MKKKKKEEKARVRTGCEMEYFRLKSYRLQELRVILRSRVLLGVYPRQGYRSATPLRASVRQGQRDDVNRSVLLNIENQFLTRTKSVLTGFRGVPNLAGWKN